MTPPGLDDAIGHIKRDEIADARRSERFAAALFQLRRQLARSGGDLKAVAVLVSCFRDEIGHAMLNFPNASRSYDATRHCIRFWGSDGAMEISFFLEESALAMIAPGAASGEQSLLKTFDQNRERILRTARKVYGRRRKGSYELTSSDF